MVLINLQNKSAAHVIDKVLQGHKAFCVCFISIYKYMLILDFSNFTSLQQANSVGALMLCRRCYLICVSTVTL